MERKFIAFDIDGTLLNDNHQVLSSTKEALHLLREQGHLVTIATGRNLQLARSVIKELSFDNYILSNGAAGFVGHNQVYKNPLAKEPLIELSKEMSNEGIAVAYQGLEESSRYNQNASAHVQEIMSGFAGEPPFRPTFLAEKDVYQGLAFCNDQQLAQFSQFDPFFDFIGWHQQAFDIVPKGNSKAKTILAIADQLSIERQNIIAFGDGNNDYDMLKEVGLGVAMGNAVERTQDIANHVTTSNNEDGIWNALKQFELI